MQHNSKWWNLISSGLWTFIAIIVAQATVETVAELSGNHSFRMIVTATVLTFVTSACVTAAAYNGQRFLIRSMRGRRR